MKSNHGLLCLLFTLCTTLLFAQPKPNEVVTGSVSGVVLDADLNQPIPYATVVITSGEQTITGGITNDDGAFEINKIPEGIYTLRVQFIGYEAFERDLKIDRDHRKHDMGNLNLSAVPAELDAVNIVAERTTIEQKMFCWIVIILI